MKYRKIMFMSIFISVICILLFPLSVAQASVENKNDYKNIYDNFDYSDISPYITDEIKDIFNITNNDIKSISDIRELNLSELFNYITKSIKNNRFDLEFFTLLIIKGTT